MSLEKSAQRRLTSAATRLFGLASASPIARLEALRSIRFTIHFLFGLQVLTNKVAEAEEKPNAPHPPPAKISDRFTPAEPSAVKLRGWLGRCVDEVRDDFVLPTNIVPMYLQPLQARGDIAWRSEHIGKWLDAASVYWKYTGDARMRELMEEAITGLLALQEKNGWLGSYDEP